MKPKLEDVLFISKTCKHRIEYGNEIMNVLYRNTVLSQKTSEDLVHKYNFCPPVKISQQTLESLIIDELKEKYYPGFVKYFKVSSKDCTLEAEKNAQKSVEARIKGNALLVQEKHSSDIHGKIWKLFSTSIALAPGGSKELVLAYECRSNLLLHLKKHEECLKDVDKALSITDFDLLKVKLLCRKITCFVAMNKNVAEKEDLWKILKFHFDKINSALKNENFLKIILQAKVDAYSLPDKEVKDEQKSSTVLNPFANVVLSDNKKGRIMANRDFEAGETVIETKATIASVNPDHFYAYCSYCLSFMWAGIPCDECSLCMYCSEECKKKAWEKYHILECKVNPHIDFYHSIYYDFTVSIKIFLMGVTEFGSISKLMEKVREIELLQDDPNFTKGDKLFDSEFLNVYTLSNKRYSDLCILSNLVKNTCFLMAYLTQTVSEIFEKEVGSMKGKELAKDDNFVHSTYVMLKIMMLCGLYMQFPVINRYLSECPKYKNTNECLKKRCCSPGSIFHFFKGLMEKSCNPNVAHCENPDGKTIYYCTQPIKKMEMITATLTYVFYQCDRMERLRTIPCAQAQSLYELCQCTACRKDWTPFITKKEAFKNQTKFYRRTSIVQTAGTELTQKYLGRFADTGAHAVKYFEFKENEFEELARDTNTVISTCSQPSFASSWMMLTLCEVYLRLYADKPMQMHIPNDC